MSAADIAPGQLARSWIVRPVDAGQHCGATAATPEFHMVLAIRYPDLQAMEAARQSPPREATRIPTRQLLGVFSTGTYFIRPLKRPRLGRSQAIRRRSSTGRTNCKHRASPAATGSFENLHSRKNGRIFEEKRISRGKRGGIIVVDLHLTRRRPVWIGLGAARAVVRIFLASALTWCAGTMAAAATDFYRAQAIVTGQGEANRIIGFAACLEDVLIKVSGAPTLAGDPRLAAYKSNAESFVRVFGYHDQMSGKPIRDEQGTRDRPYDLTVDFEERKIDGVLKALGLKPWLLHRPRLAVFAGMEQGPKNYIITADGAQSELQRDALLAAADRRGMDIVVPSAAALTKSGLNGPELKTVPSSTLAPVAAEQGGEVALVGQLVWDDRKLGWATQWQMDWHGRTHRWQVDGVTFDEAFRRGIGGAAQVLSGNGDPGGRR